MIGKIYQTLRKCFSLIHQFLIELVFPRRCPVCDKIVIPYGELICPGCHDNIKYIGNLSCKKCGKNIAIQDGEYCFDCNHKTHYFDEGKAVYDYHSVKESLYRMKYNNRKEYADFFGLETVCLLREAIMKWNPDALIPVPLHQSKLAKRGYNQAELIADVIGRRMGIPVRTDLVVRCKKTRPQKELTLQERQNNLKRAFKLVRNDVKLKTIILIDDIFTTGSTLDSMAYELKHSGVSNVYFITLASGEGI